MADDKVNETLHIAVPVRLGQHERGASNEGAEDLDGGGIERNRVLA